MWSLRLRMWQLTALLFGIIYAVMVAAGTALGIGNFYFYLILSVVMMLIQYLMGPKLIEWSMHVRYLKEGESPELHSMVRSLATAANIPSGAIVTTRRSRSSSKRRLAVLRGSHSPQSATRRRR